MAFALVAKMCAGNIRGAMPEKPPSTTTLDEPELLFKVKEAKDTLEKLNSNNLTGPLAETKDRALATLEGAFDEKYDSYSNIDMTRNGIETFMNRLR